MNLATLDDLTTRMTSVPDSARADAVLADVSAAVRAYTGQTITRAVTTERFRVRRAELRLPQRPVNSVDDVTNVAGEVIDAVWDGLDRLVFRIDPAWDRVGVTYWEGVVDVTYDHGRDVVPDDVVTVVCNVAARAMGSPPEQAAIAQTSITNYAVTIGPVGAAGSVGLFSDERAILDRYRRWGVAWSI